MQSCMKVATNSQFESTLATLYRYFPKKTDSSSSKCNEYLNSQHAGLRLRPGLLIATFVVTYFGPLSKGQTEARKLTNEQAGNMCGKILQNTVEQGWPNNCWRAASGPPTSLIRPAKYFAHFFQAPRFRLWTAVQQHWLLPVT